MLVRAVLVVAVAIWAMLFVSAALSLAHSPVVQFAALAVGLVPLVMLLRPLARLPEHAPALHPPPPHPETELLRALHERGELTAATAALSTSLTLDQVDGLLDALARKGHVITTIRDGALVYRLAGSAPQEAGPSRPEPASPRADPLIEPLSERELEVLTLLARGKANKEIARALGIAEGTVKTHTNNIYRKLDVRNRTEALVRARALGLIADSGPATAGTRT